MLIYGFCYLIIVMDGSQFNVKECIIYAQTGIIDLSLGNKTPLFIASQQEVRPAVQALIALYCKEMQFREEHICGHTRVFNLSEKDQPNSALLEELVKEAVTRDYTLPSFDAVIVGIHYPRNVEFTPLFNLDKVLAEYYIQRFDPR